MNINIKKYGFVFPLLTLTSCATLVNGPSQSIGITTEPTGANVYVDSNFRGSSPITIDMSRSQNHIVRVELEGFEPYEIHFSRNISKWVFGNIVIGGPIGVAIDAVSGGLYRLSPDQIYAEMRAGNIAYSKKASKSCFAVVMKAKPEWEKIGNLERLAKN